MNIELWKNANAVYVKLMDLTVSDALNQLSQMDHLDDELKSVILTLISSGNQPSQYFKQHISANFQLEDLTPSEYKSGDQVDGYELLEELGVGGMARVYKARKIDADSQKPVAIKLFNRSGLSPLLLNRFSIEQDVLSGLSHPNIVNMHHGGTSDQGVPYIVMELIDDAQDIDQYAQAHQASLKQKISWVVAAAKAIAYAHNNLIVHRDIKPSNLLVDKNGQLKVVDFGIAKLMTKEDAPQKTTIMALTPSFAAPEQINSGQISVTTDVFSLAVVCLSLIIEDLPLPADRLLKSCSEDEAHIWDLRNILNQALQMDSQNRYRNMDLFADDLNAWLDDKPVLATPDSWFYRLQKFAKRRSALFAALTTLLVMLVLSISLLAWQTEKTRQEATKAKEVKEFMLSVFSVVNPDEAQGDSILAKDLLSQALVEIDQKKFADADSQVELLTSMGTAQLQLGLYQDASDTFESILQIDSSAIEAQLGLVQLQLATGKVDELDSKLEHLDQQLAANSIHRANWLLLKSGLLSHNGVYDLSQQLAQQARNMFEQNAQFKQSLEAARQLANIMFLISQSEPAAEFLEEVLVSGLEQLPPTNTAILSIQNDLIELYNDYGDYPSALSHSERLIENIKSVLGEKHPFLIQGYISRAGTNRATGAIDEAEKFANLALSLSREVNGEQHETTARAMNFQAVLYYVKGDIENALKQMRKASALYDQVMGDDHPDSWDVKTNLTALLNLNKQYEEAIAIAEPLFKKQTEVLGLAHKSTIYSQTILARLYGDVGRLNDAQKLGEDMLEQSVSAFGFEHPLTVGGHFTLAKIYQLQGRFKQAIALMETVIKHESWRENNERVITAYNTLADLYFEDNRIEDATNFKEKSLSIASELLTTTSPKTVSQMLKTIEFYITINKPDSAARLIEQVSVLLVEHESLATRFEQQLDGLTLMLSELTQ